MQTIKGNSEIGNLVIITVVCNNAPEDVKNVEQVIRLIHYKDLHFWEGTVVGYNVDFVKGHTGLEENFPIMVGFVVFVG